MAGSRDKAKPFMVWLQRDADGDLIELISDAAKRRRTTAEICRLQRLPWWKRALGAGDAANNCRRAVFRFAHRGMPDAFWTESDTQNLKIQSYKRGSWVMVEYGDGTVGWPVMVRELSESLFHDANERCWVFHDMLADASRPADGAIELGLFYRLLVLFQEIVRPQDKAEMKG